MGKEGKRGSSRFLDGVRRGRERLVSLGRRQAGGMVRGRGEGRRWDSRLHFRAVFLYRWVCSGGGGGEKGKRGGESRLYFLVVFHQSRRVFVLWGGMGGEERGEGQRGRREGSRLMFFAFFFFVVWEEGVGRKVSRFGGGREKGPRFVGWLLCVCGRHRGGWGRGGERVGEGGGR